MLSSNRFAILPDQPPDTPTPNPRKRHQKQERKTLHTPDNARIKYQVRLPDTIERTIVQRHTPIPDLQQVTPIKTLAEAFGGEVEVSPERSACSETDVIDQCESP